MKTPHTKTPLILSSILVLLHDCTLSICPMIAPQRSCGLCDYLQASVSGTIGMPVKQGLVAKCTDNEVTEGQCARDASLGLCGSDPRSMLGPCKVRLQSHDTHAGSMQTKEEDI